MKPYLSSLKASCSWLFTGNGDLSRLPGHFHSSSITWFWLSNFSMRNKISSGLCSQPVCWQKYQMKNVMPLGDRVVLTFGLYPYFSSSEHSTDQSSLLEFIFADSYPRNQRKKRTYYLINWNCITVSVTTITLQRLCLRK